MKKTSIKKLKLSVIALLCWTSLSAKPNLSLPVNCSDENIAMAAKKLNVSVKNLSNLLRNTVVTVKVNKKFIFSSVDAQVTQTDCSGFFVFDQQHVATAAHCVVGSDAATIILSDGTEIAAKNISHKNTAYDTIILELEEHAYSNISPITQELRQTTVTLDDTVMVLPGCQGEVHLDKTEHVFAVGTVDQLNGGNALKSPAYLISPESYPMGGKSGGLVISQNLQAIGLLSSQGTSHLPKIWHDQANENEKRYIQGGVTSIVNLPDLVEDKVYDKSFAEFFEDIRSNQDPYASFFLASVLKSFPNTHALIRSFYSQAETVARENREAFMFHWIANYAYYDLKHTDSAKHYFDLANTIQKDPHTLFHLAMLSHLEKNYDQAKAYAQQAVDLDPKHLAAQYYLSTY
ncbi:trypsin-like peptidase domain-containing protein [bacterium]|nr:trypsin-like peptidase domain-containing protein [bacterium]